MRLERVYRDWDQSMIPWPRVTWYFEECSVEVGVEMRPGDCDRIVGLIFALELTGDQADRLWWVQRKLGAVVCRFRGHRWARHVEPEGEHCRRCWKGWA